jgi:quercetin dioxygenase-like cupin family protein
MFTVKQVYNLLEAHKTLEWLATAALPRKNWRIYGSCSMMLEPDDIAGYSAADQRFHESIAQASDNETLIESLSRLKARRHTLMMHDGIKQATEENTQQLSWGHISWLVGAKQVAGAEQTLGVVTVYTGKRNPLHVHPNCEELLYVLSGECDHKLGNEVFHLTPGMVICIPRGTAHWARCTSDEPLVAVISFSSPDRRTDTLEGDEIA